MVARDESVVETSVPSELLVLTVRGRPVGEARVVLSLVPDGDRTEVTMSETPVAGLAKWVDNPVTEALLTRRNIESLARLAALVER